MNDDLIALRFAAKCMDDPLMRETFRLIARVLESQGNDLAGLRAWVQDHGDTHDCAQRLAEAVLPEPAPQVVNHIWTPKPGDNGHGNGAQPEAFTADDLAAFAEEHDLHSAELQYNRYPGGAPYWTGTAHREPHWCGMAHVPLPDGPLAALEAALADMKVIIPRNGKPADTPATAAQSAQYVDGPQFDPAAEAA